MYYWFDLSAGGLASFTNSLRLAMSSSLRQLGHFKQTTLHWFMGDRNYNREEQGTASSSVNFLFIYIFFFYLPTSSPAALVLRLCGFVMIVATHSSFCGSMNVKGLVAEDAAHLKLNGSLCKQTLAQTKHFTSMRPTFSSVSCVWQN